MSLNDEVCILRQVPLLAGADILGLKRLAFASKRLHFEAGEVIFHQGDPGDCAYLLLNGYVDVLVDGPAGPVRVAEIPERSIIGEIAVLCEGTRTATVRAAVGLDALRIARDDLLRLLQQDSAVTLSMLRMMAERLSATTDDLIAARAGLAR
ncbi:cyclic nucleotide-binding domain-containing protein [Paenirhodobacter enshiensis]|uniref:cyclic nucleotide-binding domain-containing protein n=1 Tax=Paenirhodobacter enshiensis TaxID=1105367 RepID=UPI0035AFAE45